MFQVLDPKPFEAVFRRGVGGVAGALGSTVAVDGKIQHGSAGADGRRSTCLVSAFATTWALVLGQEKAAGRSNEITIIPELLDVLYLKGLLVRIG